MTTFWKWFRIIGTILVLLFAGALYFLNSDGITKDSRPTNNNNKTIYYK